MPRSLWVILPRKPIAALMTAGLLGGCANVPGGCAFGFSHEDCLPAATAANQFPSDDAICRSYGFKYDSPGYARCRAAKADVQAETKAVIDTEWWKSGL